MNCTSQPRESLRNASAGAETAVKKWGGSCWTLHAERCVARYACHYLGGSGGMPPQENLVFQVL